MAAPSSAVSTKPPGPTTLRLGIGLFAFFMAGLSLWAIQELVDRRSFNTYDAARPQVDTPHTLHLSSQYPSRTVYGSDEKGRPLHILPTILSDTTPYIIRHNGGASAGGIDEYIESRLRRQQILAETGTNWVSSKPTNYITVSASFILPPGYKPVDLTYRLAPH